MLMRTRLAHDSTTFAHFTGGGRLPTQLLLITSLGLAVTGCLADELDVSTTSQAATVSTYVTGSCSTAVVLGLSKQIADEIACASPTLLKRFTPTMNLQLTSNAVLPYLASGAKTALESVAASRTVKVNSAFRTVAQQYLLYRWSQAGRCGITAAATPGKSNHETGRALDLQNYSSLITPMRAKGWSHNIPGDPVHFDHLGSPDSRGKDVAAFQRLWNRNHPNDKIATDGSYGPATEARLRLAPATGFAIGPSCGSMNYVAADVVAVDGPDRVQPATRVEYRVTLQNNSESEWPPSAILHLSAATSSTLHDPSWLSATQVARLGAPIAPGGTGMLTFSVTTPSVIEDTPLFEPLSISDGDTQLGSVHLALTVVPNMEEETSGESDDHWDQEVTGGCSAGGGHSAGVLLLLALGLVINSRKRALQV